MRTLQYVAFISLIALMLYGAFSLGYQLGTDIIGADCWIDQMNEVLVCPLDRN